MTTVHKVIPTLSLVGLTGCTTRVDVEKERAAILQTDKEWLAAALEGRDLGRIVSFWTDDAIVFPPGSAAVVGKEAIR